MEVISLRGVSKAFGKKQVLRNIGLSINSGELVGLIGKSGSGKSVLIKVIIGFLKPDTGDILIKIGRDKINFSMQGNSIHSYLTVKQNLKYFSKMYDLPRKERKAIIEDILNKLNLREFEDVLVKKLSGGTQKRVDIGCSLLNNPDILILDEPFLGLDPDLVNRLAGLVFELNKKGKTIIISSHDIEMLKRICSKFILINNGNLNIIDRKDLGMSFR